MLDCLSFRSLAPKDLVIADVDTMPDLSVRTDKPNVKPIGTKVIPGRPIVDDVDFERSGPIRDRVASEVRSDVQADSPVLNHVKPIGDRATLITDLSIAHDCVTLAD